MKTLPYVDTKVANVASVDAAFARLGYSLRPIEQPTAIANADLLLLPGVGNFSDAANRLARGGIAPALRQRLLAGRPTLGICLGMQLTCLASDEGEGVPGIGAIDQTVRRFPAGTRVPHIGWNRVQAADTDTLIESGYAYFANSFALRTEPTGYRCATAVHDGVRFVAAAERGAVLLCQFHPELSGSYGQRLLRRWLVGAQTTNAEVTPC